MSVFSSGLIKLIAAGMICGGLLAAGGKGPQREILRFGCACLMIILPMTMLQGVEWNSIGLERYKSQLEAAAEQAQAQTRSAILHQTETDLEKEIERQALALSLNCTVKAVCERNDAGAIQVVAVTIQYHSGPREQLSVFRQTMASLLAVPQEKILIQEVKQP